MSQSAQMFERYSSEMLDSSIYDPGAYARKLAYIARNYERLLPCDSAAAILEVGPGKGEFIEYCVSRGYTNLTALDLSAEVCAQIRDRFGSKVRVVQSDDSCATLGDMQSRFDAVVMLDVIEHIPKKDLRSTLAALHGALKQAGVLIVQTLNSASLFSAILRYSDLTHEIGFTEYSLEQLFRGSPFRSVDLRPLKVPFDTWLRVPQVILRFFYFGALRFLQHVEGVPKPRILTPDIVAVARRLELAAPHST